MREPEKYCGVIPAFYACYDDAGEVSPERVRALAEHLIRKGVKGVYVGGSSGECIYQSVDDRKRTLENVMAVAKGRITVIAHVACNNTRDSVELARHAESLGVDAIAAIPPIYFHLPEYAIADYWNAMSNAAPNTDFVIYNIPQLAGVALTMPLFEEMRKNPRVAAVKNSSMPVQDIQMFKAEGGKGFVVCQNKRGTIQFRNDVRHGERFAAARNAEQRLLLMPRADGLHKFFDRLRLVARRLIF